MKQNEVKLGSSNATIIFEANPRPDYGDDLIITIFQSVDCALYSKITINSIKPTELLSISDAMINLYNRMIKKSL